MSDETSDDAQVTAGLDALAALVPLIRGGRLRAASIEALARLGAEPGTLIIHRPRSENKPIEVTFMTGGVSLEIVETRRTGNVVLG